jgi:hypothetical protein
MDVKVWISRLEIRTTCLLCLICTTRVLVLCLQIINEDLGLKLDEVKLDMLGYAKSLVTACSLLNLQKGHMRRC